MDVRVLRIVAAAWLPVVGALVVVAAILGNSDGWPVTGSILVGGAGLFGLLIVAWIRQRPIAPADAGTYRRTVLLKLAITEAIGLVGFALAVVVGPWWLSIIGAVASLVALARTWPSAADRERHELLYLV